ncbi:hypothetical protein FIV42_18195 [Persicimonas caeni]|uniref:SSD domain-containing protein n=1 Tax=Persicimonas caeni TaxID=2292766 RepID=A0A4Y6PX53_PERCE|nr:MMPL family transporter [Persicimonas caeni]QDG52597.1 hypothetical protein FIV42_18195 [Persicimonas caeni]QED33819.1 MMPL family transporter [Persicimonas caeni]
MTGLLKRFIAVFFRRIVGRHYLVISALSLLLSGLAIWVIATRWNINSDFKALLPQTSAAYQAMEEVGDRVGSGSALFVVIDSPDGEANKRFAKVYAEKLRGLPEVALAHYHNDKSFFKKHQLLYLDEPDLQKLRDKLADKIRDKKRKANPLFVSLGSSDDDDDDELIDKKQLEEKYQDLAHEDYKEYLVSDDGYALTIVVRFVESSTNLEATNRLLNKVKDLGQSLEPSEYHPEMALEYGGGLINRQKEYSSILDDVQTSAVFTLVGLFLIIALYFRRLRAISFVLTPLIMSVLWTLAIGFLVYGELTTVTVFIFAILLGLGIDFSIHLLSGYDHARAEGKEPVDALIECYNTTGKATVVGAFTTFVTFLVLSFAQFRGLSQFGQVASVGVMCTLLAMMVVLPALILTVHRFKPHEPSAAGALFGLSMPEWAKETRVRRFAPVLLLLAAGLTTFAAVQSPQLRFEENFRRVGKFTPPWQAAEKKEQKKDPAAEAESQAAHLARKVASQAVQVRSQVDPDTYKPDRKQKTTGQKYTSAVSGKQSSTPTLLLFDDPENARQVYEHMSALKREGKLETVRSVASIYAFMPGTLDAQKARMDEIAALGKVIDDDDRSFLDKKERKRVAELDDRVDVEPFSIYDLPTWTKRLFKEAGAGAKPAHEGEEYAFEYTIYVNEAVDHMKGAEARRFLSELQQVKKDTGIDFRIGSQSYIYTAMLDEIKNDGVVMLSIALIIVFLILAFTFRHPLRGLVAFTPLLLGALWMFGIAAFVGLRLDFFNVIILPVVIGLGVDDGVHFYYHYREKGRGSVGEVLRKVGSAITMTSITSMIGFGGLAVTDYAGLQSIGYLAIIGIATTLLATLLVLPAILWLGEKYDIQWLVGE